MRVAPRPLRALALLAVLLLPLAASTPRNEHRRNTNKRGTVRMGWLVRLPGGELEGLQVEGQGGTRPYIAFKGIPYAEPPVGDLRFKNPRPAKAWSGKRRPATSEGAACVQFSVPGGQPIGEEDCLYLNVYTPRLPDGPDDLMPVMVYIHGGGFQYGSGTAAENGPDFLVHRDVILVTFNYRLGAMGFLNLDNDNIPGNMGLKDQRAALQWVQENIAFFGGDPSKVTIFGNSAGSVSVHLHSIVPASRGLFSAAIMQSGNALAGFGYQEWNLMMAASLCQQLGTNTTDLDVMASTLRRASASDIRDATLRMIMTNPTLQLGYPPFGPSPERGPRSTEADKFLEQDPESLMLDPLVAPVPTIVGISGNEGHFAYTFGGLDKQPATVDALTKNVALLLPPNLPPYPDTARLLGLDGNSTLAPEQANRFAEMINSEYQLGYSLEAFITLLGDLFTGAATHRFINYRKNSSAPLYVYHFTEDGDYNWGKISFNITQEGATHTDELGYLMRITSPRDLHQSVRRSPSSSSKTLCLLTTLWTNFAIFNEPWPEHPECWPKANGKAYSPSPYAVLNSVIEVSQSLGGSRLQLWQNIFNELRRQN